MAPPDPSKPLHIVIVGGSLASLFTAVPILRHRAKHRVTILERSPTPLLHDQGAGIVAGAQTLEWLRQFADVADEDDISVSSHERLYLDRRGDVIDREATLQRMTSWGLLYRLGRAYFDGVHGETERAEYRYGSLVSHVDDIGDTVQVTYESTTSLQEEEEKTTVEADFLIAADGPSSRLRRMLLGEQRAGQRKYAGYIAFRGTVVESDLSDAAKDVFVQKFTFFHGHEPNTQILAYTIPGLKDSVEVGQRLVNWVWYWNVEEKSQEYTDMMTDVNGKTHRFTLPTGGMMQKHVWEKQLSRAEQHLPPQFVEVIKMTDTPFVQAITDLEPPVNDPDVTRLLGGKAVLVGDAFAGFRPHTAASTSQAAYHGLLLDEVLRNELPWGDFGHSILDFAWSWQQRGVMLGQRSQFGVHPMAAQQSPTPTPISRKELWMRQ